MVAADAMPVATVPAKNAQVVREAGSPYRPTAQLAFPAVEQASRVPRAHQHSASRRFSAAGLFAGIGGIELGLDAAGHETQLLCEVDPAALAVLNARFPGI